MQFVVHTLPSPSLWSSVAVSVSESSGMSLAADTIVITFCSRIGAANVNRRRMLNTHLLRTSDADNKCTKYIGFECRKPAIGHAIHMARCHLANRLALT